MGNVKGKVDPGTCHEDLEGEYRHSSALFLTFALDGGEWSTPCLSCSIPGKDTQYPFYKRVSGPQGWSGKVRKILSPTWIRFLNRLVCSKLLYQLHCPSPHEIYTVIFKYV